MMNFKQLLKEPRIIIVMVFILLAVLAIGPYPVMNDEGTMSFDSNIKQGIDMKGGARALIHLKEATDDNLRKTIIVLEKRIDSYGVKEKQIRPIEIEGEWYIQLEMAGADEEELKELIQRQGKFEATIDRNITVENGTAMFNFNKKPHDIVSLPSGAIEIDDVVLEVNDTIELEGIRLKYVNRTDDDVIILRAFVIAGEDVKQVFRDAQHARISGAGDSWHFEFSITLSSEAAQRFAAVTSDLSKDFSNGRSYLSSNIDLYLDDELVDSLRISSDLQAKVQPEIQISGPGDSRDDAWRNMNQLQSILESGALPTEIEIVQMNTISPTLGEEFMKSAVIAILFSILAVSVVIYVRYRDPRIVIPIILTSCTEVLLIFGFAAFIQWTIDLAAIAGIIAAIGSGVDDQIIITDESGKRKKDDLSLKRKLKRAFFIIFASAATTIAVMVPLLTVGAGGVRGFAFTTIIGVVIGVLFTRPAFAKVIEYLRR